MLIGKRYDMYIGQVVCVEVLIELKASYLDVLDRFYDHESVFRECFVELVLQLFWTCC
jgi:hypothetical protein